MGAQLNGRFGWLDWAVVLAVLLFTTWVGHKKAGKQRSVRDFFLGGRRLPWYAVAASIVATEISAVTYISLPALVWKPGGNITYLQLGLIGSLFAKCFIGFVLVPAYFQREIYSPYEYMGDRLGSRVRTTASILFAIGGVLGQAARVYLTAVVLEVVLRPELIWVEAHTGVSPLATSVIAITVVAVGWTLMGGIATVIWTDSILFLLFVIGIGIAMATALAHVEGGWRTAFELAREADKTRLLDFDPSPAKAYTIWVALIASTWGMIGFYGTDQLVAQRLFCCKNAREARRAIIASYGAMVITVGVAGFGFALYAYYQAHPLEGAAADLVGAKADRIFPVFLVEVIPVGLKGLVIAGAFAAAISSLDSILAALSQTTLSLVGPLRRAVERADDATALRASRRLVVGFAVLLGAAAIGAEALEKSYGSILDLALGMASYTGGALIAGFFLAFLRLKIDGRGFPWGAGLSVMVVFAVSSHQVWRESFPVDPTQLCIAAAILGLLLWLFLRARADWSSGVAKSRVCTQTAIWVSGLALMIWVSVHGYVPEGDARLPIAWPWWLSIGSLVTFVYSYALAGERPEGNDES